MNSVTRLKWLHAARVTSVDGSMSIDHHMILYRCRRHVNAFYSSHDRDLGHTFSPSARWWRHFSSIKFNQVIRYSIFVASCRHRSSTSSFVYREHWQRMIYEPYSKSILESLQSLLAWQHFRMRDTVFTQRLHVQSIRTNYSRKTRIISDCAGFNRE